MLLRISFTLLVLSFAPLILAQVPFPDPCPAFETKNPFDLEAFMGIWYEHSKYPFVFEAGRKCQLTNYKNLTNGMFTVVHSDINMLNNKATHLEGKGKILEPGEISLTFRKRLKFALLELEQETTPNYSVLDTDYTTYAVLYTCRNFTHLAHIKLAWIMTRERDPSQSAVEEAKKVLQKHHLPLSFLTKTLQQDCPDMNNVSVETTSTYDYESSSEEISTTTSMPAAMMKMLNQA